MRFRSKPVEIEAVQLTEQFAVNAIATTEPNGLTVQCDNDGKPNGGMCVTRQGVVFADLGDWIIQESDGSGCYPCKPDVFAAKYEPVAEIEHRGTVR